jgi:conjugal transfer pilus assembly protein TraD
LLAHQIIRRGEVLIVFDPKYDKELRQTLIDSCRSAGRHEAFCEFHPAFPERSVRIDCTKNFSRATEIASRIADMLGGTVHDSFTAFGWRVLQAITHGLLYLGERPTLKKLREHMESGPEVLLERCLLRFFQRSDPAGWEDRVRRQEERNAAPGQPSRPKSASARQRALVQLYRQAEAAAQCVPELTELIALTEHPREHYHKMLAGVLPLLTQLTAASLGELLSPDHEADDEREILDMEKLIREQRVLYVATDSLVDGTVGSAIAAVLLGELRAVAGARYNHGTDAQTRVHILCDEACELVTPSLIALMSKGRGAGMICYLATQTFSDYVWKFGSEDAARMVLGNGNNRLCLRVVDSKTQAYMAEGFGETTVRRSASSVSVSGRAREPGAELHGLNRSQSETTAPLFPGHLLGQLPDLHYVAALSGAKVYKGRIPRIVRHAQTR